MRGGATYNIPDTKTSANDKTPVEFVQTLGNIFNAGGTGDHNTIIWQAVQKSPSTGFIFLQRYPGSKFRRMY